MEIPNEFFFHTPVYSTYFLTDPWNFQIMLFLQYPLELHEK